jgi:HAMP domain-containing protein
VRFIGRMVLGGLAVMGVVALATLIWPHVAAVVFSVLVTALSAVGAVPVTAAARWVRGQLAGRRELRTMPALHVPAPYAPPVAVPTLHELRESA